MFEIIRRDETDKNRREFLKKGLAYGAGLSTFLLAPNVFAALAHEKRRALSFYHIHTGETSRVTYWADGHYLADGIEAINHALRDHRNGRMAEMDTRLIDTLFALREQFGSRYRFEVVSGYRSPVTNKKLRRLDDQGVAKKSYHMQGMAIDVRLPGVELSKLRKAALKIRAGGVGYYPDNNFVHLDVGRVRQWAG